MWIKLDNKTVLNNDFLTEYNKVAINLAGIQEVIYELFSKENEKDDSIPFDENDHEYNMDFSYSDLLKEDLIYLKWELSTEEYNKIAEFYSLVDDNKEKAEEIIIAFAQNLQLLFDLIAETKQNIDKKIVDESLYFFKSSIENIIKEQWKMFEIVSSNANIDLNEISKSPYLYIYNILTKEAQRIAKAYEFACLETDIYEKLKLLWHIDFSDLNLVSKFEETIEKHDLNMWNIEMLVYYNHMFEQNIKNMWDNISITSLIEYKTKLHKIIEINIDKILFDFDFDFEDFIQKEFIWHLELIKNKLENDINALWSSLTKHDKSLQEFPNFKNIIKIYNLLRFKRTQNLTYLSEMINEINSIDASKLTKTEKSEAKAELDNIFNNWTII